MPEHQNDNDANERDKELIPEAQFRDVMGKVLSVSKAESDDQLARFQASNKAKREARKPKD